MKKALLVLITVFHVLIGPVYAIDYYISSVGNDSNNGTSTSSPWATITKVNSINFTPGDRILFEGGKSFNGNLYFTSTSKGTSANPIIISSFGKGRATIKSATGSGLYAFNTAGYKITNLNFASSGNTPSTGSGIEFFMVLPSSKLDFIAIDSVEIQGYVNCGILIGSWEKTSGYQNVSITNSSIHDIGDCGISTYSESLAAHKNFYVGSNKVFNISGLPQKTNIHSGNGIMLAGIDGALVEYCEVYNTGWLNAWRNGGPVGIWGYMCNNLVIQYNESHHNRTGTTKDGGGFDIDGGCTNSIMQYNYSHDNEGAGYLVAQYLGAAPLKGVIIRYNISENDGRKNGCGGIHLWSSGSGGGIQNVEIYNNTVYMTPSATGNPKGAIHIESAGMQNINIRNNILQTTGGIPLVHAVSTAGIRFEGNNYWSTGKQFTIRANNITHNQLDSWRGTGQEVLKGRPTGFSLNPELVEPGKGVTISNPKNLASLTQYHLRNTSPMKEKGLSLPANFQINPGKSDFFGNLLSLSNTPSIGAHQTTTSSNPLEGTITGIAPSFSFEIETYPNPVKDFLEIRLPEAVQSIKVTILDSAGSLIAEKEGSGDKLLLDVSAMERGVYILRIASPRGNAYKRVLITR